MSSTDPAQPLAAAQQALSNGTGNGISDSLGEGGNGHRQGDGDDLGNRDAEVSTTEPAEAADAADTAKQHHHHTLAALMGTGATASTSTSANADERGGAQHPYGTTRDDLQARRDTEYWRQRGRGKSLELERAVAAQLGVPDKEHNRSSFSIAVGNAFDSIGAAVRQPDPPSAYVHNTSVPAHGATSADAPFHAPAAANTGIPPAPHARSIPPAPYGSPLAAYPGTPPQQSHQPGISPGAYYGTPSSAYNSPSGTPPVRAKKRRLPVPPRPPPDDSENDLLSAYNTDTKPSSNAGIKPTSHDTKPTTNSSAETNGKREPSPPPAKAPVPPSPAAKPLLNVNVASLDDDTTVFFIDDNMLLPYEEEEELRTPIPLLPDPNAPDTPVDTPSETDVSPDPDSRAARGASFSAVGHSGTALSPVARFFTPEPGPETNDTHSPSHSHSHSHSHSYSHSQEPDHSAGDTRSRASSCSSSSSLFEDLGAPMPETPMGGPVVDAAHAPATATSLAASADGPTFRPSSFGPGTHGSNGAPPAVDDRANGDGSSDKHMGSLGAVGGAAALAALKTAPETRMGGEKADWNSSITAIHGGSEGHHLLIPPLLRGTSEFTVDSSLTGASVPDGVASAAGAAAGATALHAPDGHLGVSEHLPSPSPLASPGLDSVLGAPGSMHLDPTDTAHGADPAASTASITAIRGGQEGHVPLVHARVDPSRSPSSLTTSTLHTPATLASTPLAQAPVTAAGIEDLDEAETHVSREGSETKVSEMTRRAAPETESQVPKPEEPVEPTERQTRGLGIEHASLDRGATVTSDERSPISGGATLAAVGAGAGLTGAAAMHAASPSRSPASLSPANHSPATRSPANLSPANGSAASSIPSSSPPLGSPREGDKPLPASTPRAKSRRVPVPKMEYIAPVESLSPGNVEDAVGHPATREGAGTAREPQTYPVPQWDGPAQHPQRHQRHFLGKSVPQEKKAAPREPSYPVPREEKSLPIPHEEKELPVPREARGAPDGTRDVARPHDTSEQLATATRHVQTDAQPEQPASMARPPQPEQITTAVRHPTSPQPGDMEEVIHSAGLHDHEQVSPQSPADGSPRRRHSLSGSRRAAGNLVGSFFRSDGSRPKTEVGVTEEEPWRPEPGYQGVSGLGIENRPPVRSRSRSGSMFGAAKAVVSSAGSAITNGVRSVSSPSSSRAHAGNPTSPGSPTVSHHHSTFSADASDPPSPTAGRGFADDMRDPRDPRDPRDSGDPQLAHSRNVSSSSSRRKMGGIGMGGSSIFTKLKSDMKALGAEAKAKTAKTKLRK